MATTRKLAEIRTLRRIGLDMLDVAHLYGAANPFCWHELARIWGQSDMCDLQGSTVRRRWERWKAHALASGAVEACLDEDRGGIGCLRLKTEAVAWVVGFLDTHESTTCAAERREDERLERSERAA